ncbi:cohesin domain-containing protein [Natranaeroarchaeum sulfidigenes]|uniref:Cohesin domain containing secreted protein n=1 Tax=Natranaeroarchaeum sulfidigenes TaxID=2784880 RepID=A0A897MQ18_9EURY|nr:cohesin domain-containing protein [Natranaeroarchaeum sulfidigenes]QSG02684.1 Cohesin domain containing secreted protein [Natranaeroarchaeum sulfidigenes]
MSRTHTIVVVAGLLIATAGLGAVIGTTGGSDNATILQVDPDTNEAPPGETVHIGILMTSDGGYGDVGVDNTSVGMEYDPDVLTLESVERGPWMEQGNETDIVTETEVDDEAGYVWIGQDREPHEGGATGQDRFVTFTFTVDEDAEEGEYDLELTDAHSSLTNEWPQQVFLHDGTLVVDEDASVVDAGPPEGYESGDNSMSGFGIGLAMLAVVLVAVVRSRFDRR